MATGYTWSGTTTSMTWKWFGEVLHTVALESLRPNVLLKRFGQMYNMPPGRGKMFHIPKWNLVNPVGELPIGGGTGPSGTYAEADEVLGPDGHALSMDTVPVQIRAWGGHFKFTDVWMMIEEIPGALAGGVSQLGHGLAVVEDGHIRDDVLIAKMITASPATAAFQHGGGAGAWNSVAAGNTLIIDDLFDAYDALENKYAFKWPGPGEGIYEGIFPPRAIHDLFLSSGGAVNLSDWLSTVPGQGAFERNEMRVVAGVTLNKSKVNCATDNAGTRVTGTGSNGFVDASPQVATGYYGWVLAPGAFAVVELAGGAPTIIIQPFGSAGTDDPYKRKMTVAVKAFMVAKELDLANRAGVIAIGASV